MNFKTRKDICPTTSIRREMVSRWITSTLVVVLAVLIGWFEVVAGSEFGFVAFYFIPVSLAAWRIGTRAGVLLSLLVAVICLIASHWSINAHSHVFLAYWNGALRFFIFLVIALLVGTLRDDLEREKNLTARLSATLAEVKQLKGLLPACAWCKSIRNADGAWEELEDYLHRHTEADLSHTVCPTCASNLETACGEPVPEFHVL